ncbi:MAG: DUF4097 family beta strand repeat-containing protein [Gemmatimonadota bacterium]
MRLSWLVPFTLIASASLPAQQKEQKVLLGHAASATVSIRLMAAVGNIRVIGWERDSVEMSGAVPFGVKVELFGGTPTERSKGIKAFADVPADQSGREGKLLLKVPRRATVWLKTGSAEVDVSGVVGGLDLNIVGGSIAVHGSPRELRAESMDGNVVVDGAPDWMRVKTATGDITLNGGQDVGASTISGAIRTSGGEVERAKLETTTGGISFSNTLARGANVELETHSGPIDILFASHADVELDAATITGAIDNLWIKQRPVPGREGRGMTFAASSGTGSARVTARSFKGTIQLRSQVPIFSK